jgi:hypothetical protein
MTIPVYLTQEHDQHLQIWIDSGLTGACLMHVDAHTDDFHMRMGVDGRGKELYGAGRAELDGKIKSLDTDSLDDFMTRFVRLKIMQEIKESPVKMVLPNLDIANFIIPAVFTGIVDDFYWINPFLVEDHRFRRMGVNPETELYEDGIFWAPGRCDKLDNGKPSSPSYVGTKPMILDIDLDAFCTDDFGHLSELNEAGFREVYDYKKRVESAMGYLKQLPAPRLITITRSQNESDIETYVPRDMVDEVQKHTLKRLSELYNIGVVSSDYQR